ncbi:MAG: hypothetical protein JSV88_31280, partial [Candidatus Aminicenantes bacterium]
MRKSVLSSGCGRCERSVFLFMFLCAVLSFPFWADQVKEKQDLQHEPIVEKVTVTNVEVPVRVLYKGKPVTDLTKEDFTIYENKKKMEINAFFLKRKKINVTRTREVIEKQTPSLPPRTFVLVFRITDFNEHIKKAVKHLFENILSSNDRLLIFANDKTLEYPSLEDKEGIKGGLLDELREESKKARDRLVIYINKIETYLNMHDFRRKLHYRRDFRMERLVDFLKKYLVTWNDYKKKYLTPSVDRFYFFSRYLEGIKGDKWVLNFYQFDIFPNVRMSSNTMLIMREMAARLINSREAGEHAMGKVINTLLNQILVDMNVSKDFPTEEVSKLFYKVDATFHSFFLRGVNKVGIEDVESQEVASEIENT